MPPSTMKRTSTTGFKVGKTKRYRSRSSRRIGTGEGQPAVEIVEMCNTVHQFGVVGKPDYDSKEERLEQLLDRLPADVGATLILVCPSSKAAVASTIDRCRRRTLATASRMKAGRSKAVASMAQGVELSEEVLEQWTCGRCTFVNGGLADACSACGIHRGAFPKVTVVVMDPQTCSRLSQLDAGNYQLIINYDLPGSGAEYVFRLSALHLLESEGPSPPRVAYTFLEKDELKSRPLREIIALLRLARKHADAAKKAEFDSSLEVIEAQGDDEEVEEHDAHERDDWCECAHCTGSILGSTTYHPILPAPGLELHPQSLVEVVRLPLKALEDFDKSVPLIAPRLSGYSCTLICLHCQNVHTPWDGWEQYFAPRQCSGPMRVVLVLADGVSWHEYLDSALMDAGGSPWVDILDMDSMDRSDMLLERLVDHEAALLNGQSERIVLMGMSQGGGQSMLRFLRSNLKLGGWIGSVCHVPTAPHTPRDRDPLIAAGRPSINRDQPVRLLAGESDCVFPPGLVLRDAARLRNIGGFTNVEVDVRSGLRHEGLIEEAKPVMVKGPAAVASPARAGTRISRKTTIERELGDKSPTSADVAKEAELDHQWLKSKVRGERRVPELMFVQRHLPTMINFA